MFEHIVDRRAAVGAMGCCGVAAAVAGRAGAARAARRRIDIHYHPMVPAWLDVIAPTLPPDFRARARAWTPQSALAEMDANGIDIAVLSMSTPGVWFGDVAQGRKLARACNEYMAAMRRDHPGRFGVLAALPLFDVEGSLAEIAYALDILGADGIGIVTSYGDKYLADRLFAPVFAELNRRKATVYVHPTAASCCGKLLPGVPAVVLEYPIDTSRTMLNWIMKGSTARYPDLNMIFSHAGGLLMAGIGRLQVVSDSQPAFGLPRDVAAEVAKLYYEISSSADPVTMRLLRSYVSPTHILLGTDSPIGNEMARNIQRFEKLHLPSAERRAIERDNALRLLPRLAG